MESLLGEQTRQWTWFQAVKSRRMRILRGQTLYVLYTDDSILAGPSEKEIDQIIKDLRKAKLDLTIEGDLQDFLGVNI